MKTQSRQHPTRQKPRARYSDAERIAHVRGWARSGLSGVEYARQHGLHDKSLYSWRAKFLAQAEQIPVESKNSAESARAPEFIALDLPCEPTAQVTLRMCGMELSIESGYNQAQIIGLLRAFKQEVADV